MSKFHTGCRQSGYRYTGKLDTLRRGLNQSTAIEGSIITSQSIKKPNWMKPRIPSFFSQLFGKRGSAIARKFG
ncbi:hypothetical protein GCM10025779_09110 [Arthrobacter cryoconiti]